MIKPFYRKELNAALDYVAAGGQALIVHAWNGASTVGPFGRPQIIGKLFDLDADRLAKTAERLGVRRIVLCRESTEKQHIDLVGRPLERAKRAAFAAERLALEAEGVGNARN